MKLQLGQSVHFFASFTCILSILKGVINLHYFPGMNYWFWLIVGERREFRRFLLAFIFCSDCSHPQANPTTWGFYYLWSNCRLILFSVKSELTINCIHRLPVDRPRSEGDLSPDIFILILTYNGLNLGLNQSLLPKVLVFSFPQCIQ